MRSPAPPAAGTRPGPRRARRARSCSEPARRRSASSSSRCSSTPARILLPAAHPLAARRELRCADLARETWIRAHEGGAAELVDRTLERAGIDPPLLAAGRGDEPVEAQVYVAAGAGVMLGHELNVIVNAAGIAIRPLVDGPSRRIQAALPHDPPPATSAVLSLLRELGAAHFSAAGHAIR